METKVIEDSSIILIEQANPQVVYVPSYDPVVVYGAPIYPYPPIYYPPAGYYAAGLAISFGIGAMMGAFWSGGWGWGCGWGGNNNVYVNHNNNFNRNSNVNGGNRNNIGGGNRNNIGSGNRPSTLPTRGGGNGRSQWQHNPEHRGGAPYRDRATADRFGGSARGDSLAKRQGSARQQIGRQGNRGGGTGVGNRANGAGLGSRSGGGPDRIGSRDLSRSGGGNRMLSEAVHGDTTDRVLERGAVVVHPACGLVAGVEDSVAVVAADGADSDPDRRSDSYRSKQ